MAMMYILYIKSRPETLHLFYALPFLTARWISLRFFLHENRKENCQVTKGTFFSEGGDMFVISTHRWTFFCSSISDLKSPTFLFKGYKVKKCQKSFQISKYQLEIVFSFLIGKPFQSWYIFSQWYNKDADF